MTKKQQETIRWALHEWDCKTVEELKIEALKDPGLHRILRECGIQF